MLLAAVLWFAIDLALPRFLRPANLANLKLYSARMGMGHCPAEF